jgi:hypothetical protein
MSNSKMNNTPRQRRIWLDRERELMKQLFAFTYTETLAQMLKRSYTSVCSQAHLMGLKKSESFMQAELAKQAQRLSTSGVAHRYAKGHVPANKGQKMTKDLYQKIQSTMFQKGREPHNALAPGEEVLRTDSKGKQYWMIKVPGETKLKYKHVWLWETQHGTVAKGYNIIFVDGNPLHCVLENLACISNAELMKRNTIHRFPTELKSTIRLVSKLNKTIKNAKKQD